MNKQNVADILVIPHLRCGLILRLHSPCNGGAATILHYLLHHYHIKSSNFHVMSHPCHQLVYIMHFLVLLLIATVASECNVIFLM